MVRSVFLSSVLVISTVLVLALSGVLEAREGAPVLSEANGYYSVLDYGAKGDGVTDDTGAFQKALYAAAENGGVVLVPSVGPGRGYVITRTLTVPRGVTLMGSPAGISNSAWAAFDLPENAVTGSKIYARPKPSQYVLAQKSPLFHMDGGSTVRGLWIIYDEQPWPTDAEFRDPSSPYYYKTFQEARENFIKDHVKPYGPTFYTPTGVNVVIEDIVCDRFYDFFFQAGGGKSFINRVYLYGYKRGFVYKECFDINRLSNVHFVPNCGPASPGPVGDGKTYSWIYGIVVSQEDNIGIQIGRSDGYTFHDVFFFGVHTALRLGASKEYPLYDPIANTYAYYDPDQDKLSGFHSPYKASGPWGEITGLKVDQCVIGIHFVWPSHLTNRISNLMIFTAFDDGKDFPAVSGTGNTRNVGKQAPFVVEPSYSVENNLGLVGTFMASNSIIASFNDGARFGPAAAHARDANGRVFLLDGDILMDFSGFQINSPYDHQMMLTAGGKNGKNAHVRIRGFIRNGQPLADVELDGTGLIRMGGT